MHAEAQLKVKAIANHLARYGYRYSNEDALQQRLAQVLEQHGFAYTREYALDARNRFDFWLDGIVLEVKVDGSLSSALHQVDRYINLPDVKGVILAGTPRWAGEQLAHRPDWKGKPFQLVRLERQFL